MNNSINKVLFATMHAIDEVSNVFVCVVDLRRLEYRRLLYSFTRERLGVTPPIAIVTPFLTKATVGTQTEDAAEPLTQWVVREQATDRWRPAPLRSLPSRPDEPTEDVGTMVHPANIRESYRLINVFVRGGELPSGVTVEQRRSDVFILQNVRGDVITVVID